MSWTQSPEPRHTARAQGLPFAELHERAYAGKFCSANGFYRHCLLTAANQEAILPFSRFSVPISPYHPGRMFRSVSGWKCARNLASPVDVSILFRDGRRFF